MTSPVVVALALLMLGVGSAVAGVFFLAGLGWALVAAAAPLIATSVVILRGLPRAG